MCLETELVFNASKVDGGIYKFEMGRWKRVSLRKIGNVEHSMDLRLGLNFYLHHRSQFHNYE